MGIDMTEIFTNDVLQKHLEIIQRDDYEFIGSEIDYINTELEKGLYFLNKVDDDFDKVDPFIIISLIDLIRNTMLSIKKYNSIIENSNELMVKYLQDDEKLQLQVASQIIIAKNKLKEKQKVKGNIAKNIERVKKTTSNE